MPHTLTSLVKAVALDDTCALASLGAPHPEARIALAAARHHLLAVRREAAAGHCSTMPCEHLPCTCTQPCLPYEGMTHISLAQPLFCSIEFCVIQRLWGAGLKLC